MPFPSAIGMLRSNDSILGSTTLENNETKGLPGLFKEPNLKDYDWARTRIVDWSLLLWWVFLLV